MKLMKKLDKDKLMYTGVVALVVLIATFSLRQVETASLFPSAKSHVLAIDISDAPDDVVAIINDLKERYPHLSDGCIYGSAMIMKDRANDVALVLERESKCIHGLVIRETGGDSAGWSMTD